MGEGFMLAGLWREATEALHQALMVRANDPQILELLEKAYGGADNADSSQRARQLRQQEMRTESSKVLP